MEFTGERIIPEQHDMKLKTNEMEIQVQKLQIELLIPKNKMERKTEGVLTRNGDIAHLEQRNAYLEQELKRIKTSHSWQFMGYIWKIRDIIIPKGSYRRLFAKAVGKFIKHPIRFLFGFTTGKFRAEGIETLGRRQDASLASCHEVSCQKSQIDQIPQSEKMTVDDYEKIEVPQWENPLVSIIIPAYNHFDYTYNCIKSIVKNSGTIEYEIIVGDNSSTDLTTRIQEIIHGLVLITNPQNIGFLRNCNNASKYAKGKYILLLNNDTQVQKNWLKPLVELIEQDEGIGMVGSKLIYPNGRLQEAGGIIWRDASGWNYGNQSDPSLPEYNYVKEVDYITGASIMIRRALWEEIGGFDDRYAPVYCEDSDLAFTVRQMGYRVMYQPLSVVLHFEGTTNGKDITTATGDKRYQLVNKAKFYDKWKDVLERDHFDNGAFVFVARDRSRYKKTVVAVDRYIPTFDKDARSQAIYQYLKLLVEMGYNVKLIPDNFQRDTTYSTVYGQLGIEILYGPHYAENWKNWLMKNSSHIQYVILCCPHTSIKYIDFVRAYTDAKIIYYAANSSCLEEKQGDEIVGDIERKYVIEKLGKIEYEIMEKSDASLKLSAYEKEIIVPRIG